MSLIRKLLRLPPGGLGRVVVGKKPGPDNKTGIPVTAAIFFDGTGNNRNNTTQRRMAEHNRKNPNAPMTQEEGIVFKPAGYEKYGRDGKGKPKDSYESGYSNVSILERMNTKRRAVDKAVSVYVEGIGTRDDEGDDLFGNAFGVFKTGIKTKVQIGIGRLAEGIMEVLNADKDTQVEQLTIDVFGFSRGAAAARHFVSLLHHKTPLAARLGVPKATVKIKFVGVFDTVSSHGLGLSFGSDVDGLGLDMGTELDKVVHLAAANEYRANFSLTDITSSLGKGYELVLPGVHSDIGGSYGEVTEEEQRHLRDEERLALIDQGWYRPHEISRTSHPVHDPETGQLLYTAHRSIGRRCDLTWEYQFIPLGVMATCAGRLMTLEPLAPGTQFEKYTLPAGHELAPVQAAVVARVKKHGETGRHVLCFPGDPVLPFADGPVPAPKPEAVAVPLELAHKVRNRYLHRSASTGLQGLNDNRKGMGERREDGRPHRLVFPG